MLIPFESLKPYLNPDDLFMLSFATDPHSNTDLPQVLQANETKWKEGRKQKQPSGNWLTNYILHMSLTVKTEQASQVDHMHDPLPHLNPTYCIYIHISPKKLPNH